MTASPLDRETHTAVQSAVSDVPHSVSTKPVFDSVGLLQGGREILIRHGDECYRLRHTRNDKLILTK
jgi:hemin uptake protein HemP